MAVKYQKIVIYFFLSALLLVFFPRMLKPSAIFFNLDHSFQNIPFRHYAFSELQRGVLPLWCPYSATGFPIFAEGQSGIAYLPNWLFYWILPFCQAYNMSLLAHLLLGGAGMYLLLSELNVHPQGALTSAVIWMFSGYGIRKLMFVNLIQSLHWIPLICYLYLKIVSRHKIRYRVAGFMAVGVCGLAGHPQAYTLVLITVSVFIVFLPQPERRFRDRLQELGWIVIPGLILASWQWLPTLRLLGQTDRAPGLFTGSSQMSLPPGYFVTTFLADVYGSAGRGTFTGSWQGYEWELSSFWGIAAFLMALAAPASIPVVRFFRRLAVVGCLLSLGTYTPLQHLMQFIPGYGVFRIPSRWMILVIFCVAVLAGYGVDRFTLPRNHPSRKALHPVILTGILFFGLGFCAWGLDLSQLPRPDVSRAFIVAAVSGLGVIGVCFLSWRWHGAAVLLPMIIFTELYFGSAYYPGVANFNMLTDVPETLGKIRDSLTEDSRVLSLMHEMVSPWNFHESWVEDSGDYAHLQNTLPMYSGLLFKFPLVTFDEWSPLHYSTYHQLINGLSPGLLTRMGIRYVLAPNRPLPLKMPRICGGDNWQLLENPEWSGRIFVNEPVFMTARPGVFRSRDYDPRKTVILDPATGETQVPDGFHPDSRWSLVSNTAHHMEIDLEMKFRGCLVVADAFDPGWAAWVDGAGTPIQRADMNFRSVWVDPGQHRITFDYRPAGILLGEFLSLGILSFAILLWTRNGQIVFLPVEHRSSSRWHGRLFWIAVAFIVVSGIVTGWDVWRESFILWDWRIR